VHTTKTRRLLQAAAALVAGAVVAVGAATTADAATPADAAKTASVSDTATAEPSTIDTSRLGAIVIHKFRQPDALTNGRGDGTEQETNALVPIPGVDFVLRQIDPTVFNLGTNEGWRALADLTPETAATMPKGYGVGVRTDAHGVATAPDLPLGVYLVSEVKWPDGVAHGSPFLVTVPMTDPESLSSWLYTINVYPKSVFTPPVTHTPTPDPTQPPWTPGPAVHTGGGADDVMKWFGQYWAQLCAAVAVLAGGSAIISAFRHRRRPRRAH